MFKKLLSNLPFNPSLLDQVGFYYKRLRHETAIRRLGFAFMALAFMVQFIAVLYPAEKSLAASPNNVLSGITDKNSILQAWDSNNGNMRDIYSRFGISREDIAAIPGQKPNSTVNSASDDYWTVGRLPLNSYGLSSNNWGERSVQAGSAVVYERQLHAYDSNGSSKYEAFQGKTHDGKDFWILQNSGCPTFKEPHLPNQPKPKLFVHKTLLTNSIAHPGDTVKFRVEYGNSKTDSLATDFKLQDVISSNFQFVSLDDMSSKNGNTVTIKRSGKLGYTPNPYVSTLTVRVIGTITKQTTVCNQATATSDQVTVSSEKSCVTVVANKTPASSCVATSTLVSGSNTNFTVKTSTYIKPPLQVTGYNYDVDANGSIDAQDKTSDITHEKQFTNLPAGSHTVLVYVQLKDSKTGQQSQSTTCQTQIVTNEDPRVNLSKSVINKTNSKDANGTKVKSGDVLEFKLVTKNVTATDYKNFNGQDYFGSVLQYADIADSSQLTQQGLSLDSNNYLRWNLANLKGNSTDTKTILVKVKKVIPVTNTPSNASPDFSCKISNYYGNEITMNIDCPVIKSLDNAATSLPNTGPGNSLFLGAIVLVFVGYFYQRSRIMTKELAAIRNEYTSTGGF